MTPFGGLEGVYRQILLPLLVWSGCVRHNHSRSALPLIPHVGESGSSRAGPW